MSIDQHQAPFRKCTVPGRLRLGSLIGVLFALWHPILALAQDQPATAGAPETARIGREEAARDLAAAERKLVRAEEYRQLEIEALRGAEQATDPASRKSWLDSAREHAAAAQHLEESARGKRLEAPLEQGQARR